LTSGVSSAGPGAREAAIERPDGPVVDALLEAGITVVVISPNQSRTCEAGTARPDPQSRLRTSVEVPVDGGAFRVPEGPV